MNALVKTNYKFPDQTGKYDGKVRDVYFIGDDFLVMVATDRISIFDGILPKGILFKGQVLNQIAAKFLRETKDICPNWLLETPDPMVSIGLKCEAFKVEMVIRSYITGSAWRLYKKGGREICGLPLPDGLQENQKFDSPIITPTTKAIQGHDENISKEDIIAQGLVSEEDYAKLEEYTYALFQRGTEIAAQKGLILVDTKYEFGWRMENGEKVIYLIDEIHTPDSSRYFYADTYQELFEKGNAQRQLDKEFVRQSVWTKLPEEERKKESPSYESVQEVAKTVLTPEFCESVSERYIELYEIITGETFVKNEGTEDISARIQENIEGWLKSN